MNGEMQAILVPLLGAVAAGGLIGLERSFRGRPAGFRTHTLVCLASSLLMLVSVHQPQWFPMLAPETVRIDPTRMSQGIMTGIGFLGAGVIFREGFTVHGLTTAASIWTTAAIGILVGVGAHVAAITSTILAIGVLSAFPWIEQAMPKLYYGRHSIRFARSAVLPEDEIRRLIRQHAFTVINLSYQLAGEGRFVEYQMTLRTRDRQAFGRLADELRRLEVVREFRLTPTGD